MKDKKILKELRKGPMKNMKDDEYAMIEEEVNQKGIAGLKGYAKSMIEKAMRDMAYSMKDAVRKHGEHDQASHGSWAGNGAGGRNIQDMSASDQKEFIDRMSSAKSGAEQRAIIDEFVSRQKGGAKGSTPKKIGQDELPDGSSKQGSIATTPGVLDKLFGKGETVEGDEFERKVTEAWTFEMKNPSTGETFKAQVYDWMRYDDMNMTAEQGQKLAPMGRSENGTFSIATSSKENAGAVQDYITSNSTGNTSIGGGTMSGDKTPGMTPFDGMKKAVSVKSGDMVSWNSSGGSASGKVVRVISSGKINVPDSSFSIEGTEDDPAALIQLYRDGKPTETKVGHKVSTLKKK